MALRNSASIVQYGGSRIVTAPAAEPITADELRTNLVLTSSDLSNDDAGDLIEEARQFIEQATGITMINQTWMYALDHWPAVPEPWWDGTKQGHINSLYSPSADIDVRIPRFPLSSITGVNVYDEDGNATAITVSDFFNVDTYRMPGRITLRRGKTWPIALRANNAVEITYVAGYGAAGSSVPASLRRAVKLLASSMYTHRGDECSMEDAYAISGAKAILDKYRDKRI